MEIILALVVGFILGALWGAWTSTHNIVDHISQDPHRFRKLLDEIEDPIQKLADASTLLSELADKLSPLMAFLPKKED